MSEKKTGGNGNIAVGFGKIFIQCFKNIFINLPGCFSNSWKNAKSVRKETEKSFMWMGSRNTPATIPGNPPPTPQPGIGAKIGSAMCATIVFVVMVFIRFLVSPFVLIP